jgi:hypothetical protein
MSEKKANLIFGITYILCVCVLLYALALRILFHNSLGYAIGFFVFSLYVFVSLVEKNRLKKKIKTLEDQIKKE